jgi:hypothetical protein
MKMKISMLWFMTFFSTFVITGCASTVITNYDVPRTERSILKASDNLGTVSIAGTEIDADIDGVKFIIPAGIQRVSVVNKRRYYISSATYGNTTTSTYIPYVERWAVDFEFEPGKRYKLTITTANLKYDGTHLSTDDKGVSIDSIKGRNVTITHDDGAGISLDEYGKGIPGSYVGVYSGVHFKLAAWDYGPSFIRLEPGPSLGLEIIHGNFHTIITGEAGLELSPAAYPDAYGVQFGYFYGAMANFFYRGYGIGLGAGIADGLILCFAEDHDHSYHNIPYAEAVFMHQGNDVLKMGPYFRYYFDNNGEWYKKIAVGFKLNAW